MRHGGPPSLHDDDSLGKAYDARLVRRLWSYVRPHRALVGFSLGLLFAVSAVQLVQPYLIKVAIDDHIAARRLDGLGWVALWFLAALGGEFVLRFVQLYLLERTGQSVVFDLARCSGERTRKCWSSWSRIRKAPSRYRDFPRANSTSCATRGRISRISSGRRRMEWSLWAERRWMP